jgi:twinkle protein
MRHGVHGLVIDPYNEIEHKRPSNMTETEYVSQLLGSPNRFCSAGHRNAL